MNEFGPAHITDASETLCKIILFLKLQRAGNSFLYFLYIECF